MNIYKTLESQIKGACRALGESLALDKVEATPAREAAHGDIATNAALVLAPQRKENPRAVAEKLAASLARLENVTRAEVAGPGFVNLTLKPEAWQAVLPVILKEGSRYGDSTIGGAEKVNVEFVSANPTGPMHVGHGRGAVFGDALASLLEKAGFQVTREYYINDAGAQIDKLADSAHLRYREALGEAIGEIPEGLYPGEYMKDVGRALAAIYGDSLSGIPREEWLPTVRPFAVEANMATIKDDLATLGIRHGVFTSERQIVDRGLVDEAMGLLKQKGLLYTGVLEPPKGKTPEDWEPRPQLLFKSGEFGDDCDRPVKKSDGSWTYFAPDIAYHYDKCRRGFTRLIDVLGADHAGYVKRIAAAVAALSDNKVKVDVKLCQLVKFLRGGEPLKMSKRAGTFVTVREVVDEVGKDVFRFIMLTRKNDQPLDFDFVKVMEQSKDNPVFYVQYAHARCRSVIRNAASEMPEALSRVPDFALLQTPEELSLIRIMASWPRLVEGAALSAEPHRVAFYLNDLAASFHGLWNKGNTENSFRFLRKDAMELTAARLGLTRALANVIASGLHVLGVEPVEEMR